MVMEEREIRKLIRQELESFSRDQEKSTQRTDQDQERREANESDAPVDESEKDVAEVDQEMGVGEERLGPVGVDQASFQDMPASSAHEDEMLRSFFEDHPHPGFGGSQAAGGAHQKIEVAHKIEMVVSPSDEIAVKMVEQLIPAIQEMLEDLQVKMIDETGRAVEILDSGRNLE